MRTRIAPASALALATLLSASQPTLALTPWKQGVQGGPAPSLQDFQATIGGQPGANPAATLAGGACTTRHSANGTEWLTYNDRDAACTLHDLTWKNGEYLAVGHIQSTNHAVIARSTTGNFWTYNLAAYPNAIFHAVTPLPAGGFLIVGRTLGDGQTQTWLYLAGSLIPPLPVGTTSRLNSIIWDGGQYVAVGQNGTIMTSLNGINWDSRASGTDVELRDIIVGIVAGIRKHVAVGGDGTIVTSSDDGATWNIYLHPLPYIYRGVAWNGSRFVIVGTICGGVLSSPDGTTWVTEAASGDCNFMNDIAWVEGLKMWVAVGDGGVTLYNESIFTSHFQH